MNKIYIISIILILCASFIYAVDVQVSSFTGQNNPINVTTPYLGIFNYTLSFPQYSYLKNLSIKITNIQTNGKCYQEFANVSTSCGGLSTGQYSDGGAWTDGDYSTYIGPATFYVNYTIPANTVNGSLFQSGCSVSSGYTIFNVSIPYACINGRSKLEINYSKGKDGSFNSLFIACNDGTNWQTMYNSKNCLYNPRMYEEAVYWSIPGVNNQTMNVSISNYSASTYTLNASEIKNLSLNISQINNILSSDCSCSNCILTNSICNMPINFYTQYDGIMQFNLTNATYSYGIDNCSNSFNIPSNATTLNISFFDTSNVRQNVNLTTTITYSGDSSYSNTYYTSHNGINNDTYCIYPNYARLNSNIQFRYVDSSGNYYYNNQILVLSNSTNNLLLYITPSGTSTTFTVKDINTNKVLENALCTSYIELAGNYTGVESKYSDITGKIQFTYLPNNNYKFLCTKTGYLDLIFYLKPILFSAYDVPMTSLSVVNQTQDYDRISIHYYPQNFFNNQQNNFTFIIGSPNELTSYGYTLTWATGSVSNSGTNPTGEQLRNVFDINGLNTFDQMKLDYYYSTASQGTKNFTVYFGISNPASNYTMMANFNRTYGLGIFERVLISVFIVILCAGLGALIGQPVPGFVIGLCVLGYLSFINFFPWWAGAITFVFGAVMVMLRHE